jgi:small subunit ribosomal protein S1
MSQRERDRRNDASPDRPVTVVVRKRRSGDASDSAGTTAPERAAPESTQRDEENETGHFADRLARAAHPAPSTPLERRDPLATVRRRPAPTSTDASNAGDEDFAAMFAASEAVPEPAPRLSEGQRVRGRVVALAPEHAFISIGGKAEAVISVEEFRDAESGEVGLAIGDLVEATVIDDGRRSGSITLKRTVGRGGHLPGELEQAHAHGIPVEGLVTGQNKGGFDVQIGGQRAFCPSSQIDIRRADPNQYIGQRLTFIVTKVGDAGRNIVVSRRSLLEEEQSKAAATTWERLKVGDTVEGTVTSIRDYGAFVDVGGVEGLIHVTELGHGRPAHAKDVVQVGQRVEAQVVKLEPPGEGSRGRIGLSLRALAPDPWSSAAAQFPVGTTVRGKVRRLEAFGAFVELASGLDGLIHVSRMSLEKRVAHPKDVVKPGDEVDVTVVSVEPDKKRIALSMVEQARRERDAGAAADRAEARAFGSTKKGSLGTLGDLIAQSRTKGR